VEQLVKTHELKETAEARRTAVGRLQRFRGELADLAYSLERRGRVDAADAVNAISARVAEIETELAAPALPHRA
jgi:hypothetical protein